MNFRSVGFLIKLILILYALIKKKYWMVFRFLYIFYFMKLFFALVIAVFSAGTLLSQVPEQSTLYYRVTNRKYISQLLFENIQNQNIITFLMTHPRHDAFKSVPHHLYYSCGTAGQCIVEMKKIDAHLRSGENLGLALNGTLIVRIDYELPDSQSPLK
jgi:hypothetical protein